MVFDMTLIVLGNILLNALYASLGSIMCVFLVLFAYKLFERHTPVLDVEKQLKEGNIAVGIVAGCLVLGLCLCNGIVVGMALK